MTKTPRILGVQAREKLGLIQRTNTPSRCPNQRDPSVEVIHPNHLTCQDVLEEFKDEFAGLPVSSRITSLSTTWSLSYTHPVEPHDLHDRLEEKLVQMERDGIIAKVVKPTDWVNSLVIVQKKMAACACLDPRDLNRAIRGEHFQISTLKMSSPVKCLKRYFTVLDQKDSYWQVPLSEQSSYLCTFNCPFGRYRFLRLPIGICSEQISIGIQSLPPEVLQKKVYKVFGDMQG